MADSDDLPKGSCLCCPLDDSTNGVEIHVSVRSVSVDWNAFEAEPEYYAERTGHDTFFSYLTRTKTVDSYRTWVNGNFADHLSSFTLKAEGGYLVDSSFTKNYPFSIGSFSWNHTHNNEGWFDMIEVGTTAGDIDYTAPPFQASRGWPNVDVIGTRTNVYDDGSPDEVLNNVAVGNVTFHAPSDYLNDTSIYSGGTYDTGWDDTDVTSNTTIAYQDPLDPSVMHDTALAELEAKEWIYNGGFSIPQGYPHRTDAEFYAYVRGSHVFIFQKKWHISSTRRGLWRVELHFEVLADTPTTFIRTAVIDSRHIKGAVTTIDLGTRPFSNEVFSDSGGRRSYAIAIKHTKTTITNLSTGKTQTT